LYFLYLYNNIMRLKNLVHLAFEQLFVMIYYFLVMIKFIYFKCFFNYAYLNICFRIPFKMISKETIFVYTTCAIVVLFTAVYLYYRNIYSYWKKLGVYHLEPTFFFGNAKERVLFKKSFHEFHRDMYFKFKGHRYAG